MAESFSEQLNRLRLMVNDTHVWCFPANDRAAIKAVLESHARLLAAAKRAYQFAAVEVPGSTTGLSPSFRNPVVDMLREAIAAAPA